MPRNTPIYGFTYPCEDEGINASAFSTLANQIDTKLNDVKADADLAVGRYNSIQAMSPDQGGIASGVMTQLTNAGAAFTAPAAGVYVGTYAVFATATTIDYMRLDVFQNVVTFRYGRSYNAPGGADQMIVPGATVIMAAGDTLNPFFSFVGTGTATVQLRLDVRMIVRIA